MVPSYLASSVLVNTQEGPRASSNWSTVSTESITFWGDTAGSAAGVAASGCVLVVAVFAADVAASGCVLVAAVFAADVAASGCVLVVAVFAGDVAASGCVLVVAAFAAGVAASGCVLVVARSAAGGAVECKLPAAMAMATASMTCHHDDSGTPAQHHTRAC